MIDDAFKNLVVKFFRKHGWGTGQSWQSDFVAQRDIFEIEVLLGPELYDRRYPLVTGFVAVKLNTLRIRSNTANVLIVLRDRSTQPFFLNLSNATPTTVVHWDDLSLIDGLRSTTLIAAKDPDEWAVLFAKKNNRLRRELAEIAAASDTDDDLVKWP